MARRSRQQSNTPTTVIGVLVLAAAVGVILFTGNQPLTVEFVRAELEATSARLAANASVKGRQASLSYGEIRTQGFLFDTKVVVQNPVITYTSTKNGQPSTVSAATDYVVFGTGDMSGGNFYVDMPAPIRVQTSASETFTLSDAGTPRIAAAKMIENGTALQRFALQLTGPITVSPPDAGEGAATPKPITISFAPNPTISLNNATDGSITSNQFEFKDISIVAQGEAQDAITIASANVLAKKTRADKGDESLDVVTQLTDLAVTQSGAPGSKYDFTASIEGILHPPATQSTTHVGDPVANAPTSLAYTPPEAEINVREISLGNDHFKATARGLVVKSADDSLPFGTVEVDINNFSYLRDSDLISAQEKPLMMNLITQINGEPLSADAKDFVFKITREKLGTSYVGKTTFEALTASLMANMMALPESAAPPIPPAVSTAPLIDKPATTPVQSEDYTTDVPEETRGPSMDTPSNAGGNQEIPTTAPTAPVAPAAPAQ